MTRRQRYFVKQKLIGLVAIILGIVTSIVLKGDATFCIIAVPVGLGLIFTRKMVITDDYSLEIERRRERKGF